MGLLAAIGTYTALVYGGGGAVTATTALTAASLVGTAVASTEYGWVGESQGEVSATTASTTTAVDKTSEQQSEELGAATLGSEESEKKKTTKASFTNTLSTPANTTGIAVGSSTSSGKVTGVKL